MKRVTTPYGTQHIAPPGAVPLAAAIDLFAFVVVLGSAIQVIEGWGLVGPDSWLHGVAALVGFAYAFLAHRGGAIFSVGQWCLGLERYKYQEVEEFEGKGVLYVLSAHPRNARFKRLIIVVAGAAIFMLVAKNL